MRNARKILSGIVISDKMQKTVTVEVHFYKKDPLYSKRIKKTNTFHVHDENEISRLGDLVNFMETRPLSKTKKFRLLNVLSSKNKEKPE